MQDPDANVNYSNVIEYSHPLSQRVKGPRNYIFRFYFRHMLFQFMVNKRKYLQFLNKKARDKSGWSSAAAVSFDGKSYLKCAHDLADTNRSLMKYLHSAGIATRTKLSGTSVAFMPKDGPSKWIKVQNPMALSHIGLITPLPPLQDIMSTDNLIVKFMRENGQSNRDHFFQGFVAEIKSLLQDLIANKLRGVQTEQDHEDQHTPDHSITVDAIAAAEFPAITNTGTTVPTKTGPASGTTTGSTTTGTNKRSNNDHGINKVSSCQAMNNLLKILGPI